MSLKTKEHLDEWAEIVHTRFPHLSKPQAVGLALWSFGMIFARRCSLGAVTEFLRDLLGCSRDTMRSRLREWYKEARAKSGEHRQDFDPATCFLPLLNWILKDWPSKEIALAMDATALADRLVVLSIAVVYRGNAIPIAWKVLPAQDKHPWRPEWIKMFDLLRRRFGRDWTVIVMADCGLYARWLFEEIRSLGWHPLLRIQASGTFQRESDSKTVPVTELVSRPGQRWQGRGIAFPRDSDSRLPCTLMACWESGYERAWFIVTDLPPARARVCWYGLRGWMEQGYKLMKSNGWQWHHTRMEKPERVERHWLAIAVATMWTLRVGGEREEQEHPSEPELVTAPAKDASVPRGARSQRPTKRPKPRCTHARSQGVPSAQQSSSACRKPRARRAGQKRLKYRKSGTRQRALSVFLQAVLWFATLLESAAPMPQGRWYPERWPGAAAHGSISQHQIITEDARNPP